MAESDELRLTITAVDQASPVLKDLSAQISAISGGAAKNNLDIFRGSTKQANEQFRTFGEDIKKASEQVIPPFIRGIGGIATAFVGVAFATDRALKGLSDYARAATNMAAAAEKVGTSTAQYKGMVELLERSGLSASAAESNIQGLVHQWGELQKQGSQFAEMIAAKGGMPGDRETIEWIEHLREAHLSVEEVGNAVKERGEQIYQAYRQRMLTLHPENIEGARAAAANVRDTWLRAWEAPELYRARQKFVTRTPEEIAAQAARDSAAAKYLEVTESIAQHWEHIMDMWKTDVFNSPLMKGLRWIDDFLAKWEASKEKAAAEKAAAPPKQPTIRYPAGSVPPHVQTEFEKKGVVQSIEDYLAAHHYEPPAVLPRGGTAPPGGTSAPGKPLVIPHYQEGGIVQYDTMAKVHAGEIIHPAEGKDAIREQTKQTRELAEQMKRLNDWLQMSAAVYGAPAAGAAPAAAPAGTARMGGLAPGLGAGPLASRVPSGPLGRMVTWPGAYTGGTGPAVNYPGRPGGEAGSGYGGTDRYGGGNTSGGTSDPAVPGDILETAKHAALTGGPGAVDAFMKSQGYPKSGNWCGEFAASVVKAAGGTPPKNPAIAPNWRNWGQVDPTPHPGDIAVANRGVPTGATGSHVTFVEAVDPKTGTFTGLGGNQRAGPESKFQISGYTFRRSVGGHAGLPHGSDVGPGTGAGAGETPAASGSAYLAQQRAPFAAELEKNPALKLHLAGLAAAEHESDPTAVIESLYNRTAFVNQERAKKGLPPVSLEHMIAPGSSKSFYGPERAGIVDARAAQLARNPAELKRIMAAIDAARTSNLIRGATDQGSGSDPNVAWPGGKVVRQGETYNDWGAYGHEAAARFREAQQAAVARGGSIGDRAKLERDAMTHKVEGSGTIDVNVNAPRGTFVKAAGRGLFKQTNINRQMQMEKAASSVPYEE
jgi:hypothetical protein